MVRLASSCAWKVPFQAGEEALGQLDRAQLAADRLDELRHVGGAIGVGQHNNAAPAIFPEDLVRPFGLPDVGDLARWDPAARGINQQIAEALRGAQPVRQAQGHVEPAVAIDHPRYDAAVGEPAELVDDRGRLHAVEAARP